VTALRVDAIINTALNADSQRDTIRGFAHDLFYGLQLVQLSMGVRQSGCGLSARPTDGRKFSSGEGSYAIILTRFA
jgi:hypothetical protein